MATKIERRKGLPNVHVETGEGWEIRSWKDPVTNRWTARGSLTDRVEHVAVHGAKTREGATAPVYNALMSFLDG